MPAYSHVEPAEVYHKHPARSRTKVSTFLERRRIYHKQFVLGELFDEPDGEAIEFGSLAHKVLLEDVPIKDAVAVVPASLMLTTTGAPAKNVKATNAYRDFKDEQRELGKVALLQSELEEQQRVLEAVLSNPFIGNWMRDYKHRCYRERSVYWDRGGIQCRCRPDWWFQLPDENIVFDFKFSCDASPGFAQRRIDDVYWLQDAMYSDGVTTASGGLPTRFFFLFVERGIAPYVAPYICKPAAVANNVDAYLQAMYELNVCETTNDWREPWEKQINVINERKRK